MQVSRGIAGIFVLIACLAAPLGRAALASTESRFEGVVLRTHVTICQFKPRGCAGYMEVATERGGRRAQWTVQVRLGVPIRRGDDYVYLASLGGKRVSIVHVNEDGAIIARSIEVLTEAAR